MNHLEPHPAPAKILLVDDQPRSARALEALLATGDRRVITAESGEQALKHLLENEFAVILMDVQMPGMDGFETAALIRERERNRTTPIIFVTAFDHNQDQIRRAYSLGAVDFLFKPIDPDVVRSKVTAFVDLHRHTMQLKRDVEKSLEQTTQQLVHVLAERELSERQRLALLARERAARAEAEAAGRVKDEFLATLSHELRTPLNVILGWAQFLLRCSVLSEDVRQAVETIERNAKAQTKLINDLLDLSRIASGSLRLEATAFDPITLVHHAVNAARPTADTKGVRIETDIAPAVGPICGDPNRLQQVVSNLLSNAVKFTPAGGSVRIALTAADSGIRIEVRDTGRGISPAFMPHLFERFRQADASTTRTEGGLGLGLAIVKHLVELHGGTVRAESAGDGRGSTFIVELPERPAGAAAGAGGCPPAPSADLQPAERLDGVKVLVVDDDVDARDLLTAVLTHSGADVLTAGSAGEGLDVLKQSHPDVLLSDLSMPAEDGYDLIRKVRRLSEAEGGRTPAAALTASAGEESRKAALAAGYEAHIPKPVQGTELVHAVAGLLHRVE